MAISEMNHTTKKSLSKARPPFVCNRLLKVDSCVLSKVNTKMILTGSAAERWRQQLLDKRDKQSCDLGLDVSVSRRSRDVPTSRLGLVSTKIVNVSVSEG